MRPDENDNKLDRLICDAIGTENLHFDFNKWKQQHQSEIEQFQSQEQRTAHPTRLYSLVLHSTLGKAALAVAALIILAVLLGRDGRSVAWADIVEKFRSVPFFSAVIYMKEDATSEPKQMELWMSRDGRTRIRLGTQVIFGRNGSVVKAFDIKTRLSPAEADERAASFLRRISEANEFSLDSVVKTMFRGAMQDVTPLINPSAVISEDMVVFDVELPGYTEWVRIWALRESRLPVRIRIWDPRDGEVTDAIFEYSKEQANEFFDPNAFESLLQNRRTSSQVNLTYAFLKDPGGRKISPEEMFAETGYHVPKVNQVGITPDGAVWVIADKGRNQMPNGYSFYGFGKIQDDLGREYVRLYCSHRTATDQSMEVFAAPDYPFDKRVPTTLTLICEVGDYNPYAKRELIGTIELTQWKQGQLWAAGTIDSSEQSFHTQMAWQHCSGKRYDKAEQILTTIQGQPEDNPAALERERIRLRMFLQQDRLSEALSLAERLLPLLESEHRKWKGSAPYPGVFSDCILVLAYAGKLTEVKQTWQRIKSIEPQIPDSLNNRARQHIRESLKNSFENTLRIIVPELSRKTHLTVEQLDEMFDIDIKKNEIFKHYTFWDWNPEFEKPKYHNWERHLEELAEYYKKHSLPETMEILNRNKKEEYGTRFIKMPGIDGYYVENFEGSLKNHARFYRFPESVGRLRIEAGIADIELNHDLIYKIDTPQSERILFILNHFGMEVVEVNEPRKVWIAHYDGRKLKDYKEVLAPVPYDGSIRRKAGMMTSSSGSGLDLDYLFRGFMFDQNGDTQARGILIIDETGIKDKVSREGPCWEGNEALDIARKWFRDEFGITFTEEAKIMTTYVIRKK